MGGKEISKMKIFRKRNLPGCRKCKKGIRGGGEKIARFFSGEHHYYITGIVLCKSGN